MSVDVLLNRNFIRRPLPENAAQIAIHALGVLAHHDEVHIFWFDAFERTQCSIQQTHRPHVGVEVHLEAHTEQNLFGVNIGLAARIAKRSGKDRIEIAAKHLKTARRDGRTIGEIAVGAPIEFGELNRSPGGLDDFNRQRGHFLTDAVAGDDGNALAG
jgi:hypothetical protein